MPRNKLFHNRCVMLFDIVDEVLDVLACEQVVRVTFDDFRDVGRQDRRQFHNGIPGKFRTFFLALGNPQRGQAERRLHGFDAAYFFCHRTRIHSQVRPAHKFAFANDRGAYLDPVLVGLELDIVTNADGRDNDSQLGSKLAANHGDSVEQVTALAHVHKRDQAVTYFELHGVDMQVIFHLFFTLGDRLCLDSLAFFSFVAREQVVCDGCGAQRQHDEWKLPESGDKGKEQHDACGNAHDARVGKKLRRYFGTQVVL